MNDYFADEMYEAQLLLTRLQFMNDTISDYVLSTSEDESKLDFGNAINTFSDCIGMYAEKLEKIIEGVENGLIELRKQKNKSAKA